jgi:hypothetical protein
MTTVTVQFKGQMCNHLFIIAAGYAHAKRINGSLAVINRPSDISDWYKSCLASFDSKRDPNTSMWTEPRFSYVPIPPQANYLTGYYQSEKYFCDVSGEIRSLFRLPADRETQIRTKWATILEDVSGCCTIHIRRGDYFASSSALYHGILSNIYYERSMQATGARKFYVFSDDLNWCRQQSWLAGCEFIDEPDRDAALYLLTQFPMIIGSNSTFSWWGAYLGIPKQVWMPATWFGSRGPPDYQDIYLKDWHRVPID